VTGDPPLTVHFQNATVEHLQEFCGITAASFREGHRITVASHEHSQKLMVWLGGLMGAGTLSVHGLLGAAPQAMRLTVLMPWIAGILCATLAGLLAGEVANRNGEQHFKRISLLELLQIQTDKELILKNLHSIIEPAVLANDPASVVLNRWLVATNSVFYLAHISFMVGIVAAATTLMLLGR